MKYLLNQNTEMGFLSANAMKQKKRGVKKTEQKKEKGIKSFKKKKPAFLPVSLFTDAPRKYATSLSGNQREEEVVFKRKIVLPAHI